MKLDTPIVYDQFVQPICLPVKGEQTENIVGTVTGYGVYANKQVYDTLKHADIESTDTDTCYQSNPAFSFIKPKDGFCAKGVETNVCFGDSGGSFIIRDKNSQKYVILGVTSGGIKANDFCNVDDYSVFIRVGDHLEWIKSIIGKRCCLDLIKAKVTNFKLTTRT
jgi:secreted trypsin-like serine protease